MKMRVTNNWLIKVLFVFCLSLISGYGFANIASTGYVDSVVGALNIPTYETGTASTSGLTKLYTGTGDATDGTMTQGAITTALGTKITTPTGGSAGQVLKKQSDGSVAWANDIDTDTNTTYSAGTGISISGTTITNSAISQIRSGGSTSTTLANIWLE